MTLLASHRVRLGAFLVFLLAAAVYWRTAYPTITWWDSSSYSIAASTLGIASAPGSLLLTLLGWPVAHFPFVSSPARALNLFAGMLAALTAALVYVVAHRALRFASRDAGEAHVNGAAAAGAALGALTLAFSDTLWEHAIKFTPYVLTAVFTTLILWTMLRWWEEAEHPDAWRQLALLGLLFGLDFSVHRTNALLIPAAFVWILVRRPHTLRQPRVWLGSTAGLAAGLALQFLLIPIANVTRSPLSFNAPTTLARLWDFVSIKDRGGSFLLQLFPRKADVWTVQIADFLNVLGANFLHWSGRASVLGVLPAAAAAFGLYALWRRDRRLGLGFALVLFVQAAMTVLYFNIPANFFRPFDRHYLPVCVTIAVLIACGLGVAMQWLASRRMSALAAVAAVVLPSAQLVNNWTARNASNRHFTRDYAENALEALPPNAIYFTVGDNDTFPIMYLQSVEGVRPDVRIVNLSLASMPNFAERTLRIDPAFPISATGVRRDAAYPWLAKDSTIVVPIESTTDALGLPAGSSIPAAVTFHVARTGTIRSAAEMTLADIVRTNRWRRPLTFAITGTGAMNWLAPYGRLDGIFWRIVPAINPRYDIPALRATLLERYSYRGYADPSVQVDDVTRTMAFQYYAAFGELFKAEHAYGSDVRCRETLVRLFSLLPEERASATAGTRARLEASCVASP